MTKSEISTSDRSQTILDRLRFHVLAFKFSKKIGRLFLLAAFLFPSFLFSANEGHFIQVKKLPAGSFVVVAEGELEPRSTGSYSVRLYQGSNPDYPFDDFVTGMVRPRDGSIIKMVLIQLTGDKTPELVVVMQSAGSGGLLSVEAYSLAGKSIKLLALLRDLPPDANLFAKLKAQIK